jgi:outer membrane receptor protein involved in Fe transport
MVYAPTEQQTIKMLWGTAVRKPTYREYLKVLENSSFVPETPETEKMETFELGYAYQWQDANISITSFYNEFDDYLHEVATPDGNDEYFMNSDNTWRMYGIEMLSVYQLNSQLNFRATLGWLKAKESGSGDLPYLSEWTASFLTDYQWLQSHHLVLSLFHNSNKEDTNDQKFSDDDSDAFTTLNVHAYGKLLDNVSYQLGVKNITDEKVFDPAGDFDERYNNQKSEREIWGKLTYTYHF